ncbi:hypothetical protein V1286_005034 [Bradyrhizobium algeriense]|jgi:hypothetical protein|uniref:Uncharacterized protein n=1 Tax=Bradyrhizobium algeriense TaxID=634784 RepID=A0ABU8BG30_9BRAD
MTASAVLLGSYSEKSNPWRPAVPRSILPLQLLVEYLALALIEPAAPS